MGHEKKNVSDNHCKIYCLGSMLHEDYPATKLLGPAMLMGQ